MPLRRHIPESPILLHSSQFCGLVIRTSGALPCLWRTMVLPAGPSVVAPDGVVTRSSGAPPCLWSTMVLPAGPPVVAPAGVVASQAPAAADVAAADLETEPLVAGSEEPGTAPLLPLGSDLLPPGSQRHCRRSRSSKASKASLSLYSSPFSAGTSESQPPTI